MLTTFVLPQKLTDISLLLHALMQVDSGHRAITHGLSRDDFRRIGGLAFTQLAELRHRGAFSTVSQTFAFCCAKCTEAEDSDINQLPEEWYKVNCHLFSIQARY